MGVVRRKIAAWSATALLAGSLASLQWIEASESAVANPACTSTRGSLVSTRAQVGRVGYRPIVPLGTTPNGQMGAPPHTDAGTHEFGWYRLAAAPGSGKGGVALNAHTCYGHTALGNTLLARLKVGGQVILYKASGSKHVCYRASSRKVYPAAQAPMAALVRGVTGTQQLGKTSSARGCGPCVTALCPTPQRTVWFAQEVRN